MGKKAAASKERADRRDGSEAGRHGPDYTVLARRWRPQQFDELVGQEPIGQALQGAIKAGRVAHAYLFTGARGVGKTSTARILAKALNCQKGPTCKPCDKCDICQSIAAGQDVDVLEIDGASNRGIDEVRELRQNAMYRPSRTRYKVYIIDEVHMLTREAFNALLKTLEEPPPHVKFIFATTDPQKVPLTILSRCQRFDFASIPPEKILYRLRQIVETERHKVDDEVLELLARRAAGSLRDAESLLDQLLAFGADRIRVEHVHQLLGTANEERLANLVDSLLQRDVAAAIQAVDQSESEGVQLGALVDQLLEYYRDLIVAQAADGDPELLCTAARTRDRLLEQARRTSLHTLLAATEILAELKARLRASEHGRLLLDLALVRIAHLEELAPIGELIERLESAELADQPPLHTMSAAPAGNAGTAASAGTGAGRAEKNEGQQSALGAPHGPRSAEPQLATQRSAHGYSSASTKLGEGRGENKAIKSQPAAAIGRATAAPAQPLQSKGTELDAAGPEQIHQLIRETAAQLMPMLAEAVNRAEVQVMPGCGLALVHLDPIYSGSSIAKKVEEALQRAVGKLVRIRVDVQAGSSTRDLQRTDQASQKQLQDRAAQDPLVQKAIETMDAKVLKVAAAGEKER